MNYLLDECDADIEQRGVYEVQEDRSRHQVKWLYFLLMSEICVDTYVKAGNVCGCLRKGAAFSANLIQ